MRKGERYRKSCRGCIVSHQISVLHLVIVKKGDAEIEGLTDKQIPRRLGPKRASKIRKLFALSKEDDVRKYVIRREIPSKARYSADSPPFPDRVLGSGQGTDATRIGNTGWVGGRPSFHAFS